MRRRLMGLDTSTFSPAFKALIAQNQPAQHGKLPPGPGTVTPVIKERKMNKTEARFAKLLTDRYLNTAPGIPFRYRVRFQPMALILGWDMRYEPDFMVTGDLKVTFYETKGGFIRDRALHKFKAAATMFPEFNFILAEWKNQTWKETQFK